MGSHVNYKNRYPSSFNYFNDYPLDYSNYGLFSSKEPKLISTVNHYDNSVRYNDFILDEIIKSVRDANCTSSVTYMSDHGEDVLRSRGHNNSVFTYDMIDIPLLFWLSNHYQRKYPEKCVELKKNADEFFSNEFLFDTLVGLYNFSYSEHNSKYDLSSKSYNVHPSKIWFQHAKRRSPKKIIFSFGNSLIKIPW